MGATSTAESYEQLLELEKDLALAEASLDGEADLLEYVKAMSPDFGPPAWTEGSIIPAFEACRAGPQRILISVPPRHGKTYTVLHALAKWISDFPADTCAYATYNQKKGRAKSKLIRQFARRSGVELDPSMANLDEWRTPQGGGLIAGGLSGGGLTGEGIQGILVVDDPIPTAKKAESKAYRDEIFDNFKAVAMTRMEGGSVIVIQTRWHDDDLIGRLEKEGGWTVINLPAIAEKDDALGREVGEALDPIRYPLEVGTSTQALGGLLEIEESLGAYIWSALFQGQPRSKGRKVFGAPHYYDPDKFIIDGCRVVIGADPAATAKESADHSALVVMAMRGSWKDPTFYILDVWRGQVQIPDFVNVLYAKQLRYHGAHIIIECVAGFKGVAQMLQRLQPKLKVFENQPTENKFMRAQPLAAAWKAGKVLVPLEADWIPDFWEELHKFTGVDDAEDDQVDATAHAYNVYHAQRPTDRGSIPSP